MKSIVRSIWRRVVEPRLSKLWSEFPADLGLRRTVRFEVQVGEKETHTFALSSETFSTFRITAD